jgi:AraC-like DNA-binding protein
MHPQEIRSGGEGLERSCGRRHEGWISSIGPAEGVELFRARFAGEAYQRHRHDTYAVGLTDWGVQMFDYRGSTRISTSGGVVVLYPDEPHDGRAGTDEGFSYRIVYVQPTRLIEALHAVRGKPTPLPFVREPVSTNRRLSRAVAAAFRSPLQSLAVDSLLVDLAEGLVAGERGGGSPAAAPRIDTRAVERARQALDAHCTRVVHSRELESVTGLTRYDLARQFRATLGTSPYRYLLMRRLDVARRHMDRGRPLAEVACDAGFADQAHFTRTFKAAFGLTPGRYRAMRVGGPGSSGERNA